MKINIEGEAFDDVADLGGQASLGKNISQATPLVQRKEIPFNNDFTLVAELSPVKTSVGNQAQASLSGNLIAATAPTPLGNGIRSSSFPIYRGICNRAKLYSWSGK